MGWPHVRYAGPEDYDLLADFDCGPENPWEEEINQFFRGLGRAGEQENFHVRVAIDPSSEKLVAAGVFRDDIEFVVVPERRKQEVTYIQALGVAEEYRYKRNEWNLTDYTGPGDFMLTDLLLAIHEHWEGQERVVLAQIATDNLTCQRLVDEQGFRQILSQDNGYDTWGARV